MGAVKLVAILLLVVGVVGVGYGGFTYTKDTHETKIGPIDIAVKDKETVNIPLWVGVGSLLVGGLLLSSGLRK
jgi:hypothetical protein